MSYLNNLLARNIALREKIVTALGRTALDTQGAWRSVAVKLSLQPGYRDKITTPWIDDVISEADRPMPTAYSSRFITKCLNMGVTVETFVTSLEMSMNLAIASEIKKEHAIYLQNLSASERVSLPPAPTSAYVGGVSIGSSTSTLKIYRWERLLLDNGQRITVAAVATSNDQAVSIISAQFSGLTSKIALREPMVTPVQEGATWTMSEL